MSMRRHTVPYSVITIKHLKGEETSTNSVATIFAWSGALQKARRTGRQIPSWKNFADKLEKACVTTIEAGKMTKDLALITTHC